MSDSALLARMFKTMREGFHVRQELGSEEGRLIRLDGVSAAVTPQVPDRSFVNAVVYESPGQLAAALAPLAEAYEEAGVRAWTVWVPEADREAQALLAAAGHRLDAAPMAQGLELKDLPPSPVPEPEWSGEWDPHTAGRINDTGFDMKAGSWEATYGALPAGALHQYITSVEGQPAAVVIMADHEDDSGFWFAATLPEARGRGLVTGMLYRALVDARERGCKTSTTQATAMGQPVYRRVGYRDLGKVQMWERRKAPAA